MDELTRGVANLVKPALDSEFKDESLGNLLMSCADQRVFCRGGTEVSSVVSLINSNLNESSTRFDGLILLRTFLPQCSLDILSHNACSWMQFCLKGFPVSKTSDVAFTVFRILLEQSTSIPELTKYVSSVVIPSFAEQINQGIPPLGIPSALQCLEQCMRIYNGPCGPHRKVFERFLFSMVDVQGPERYKAARCVAFLPQIGGGGVAGIQYENSWVAQHHSIIRTLHLLLDDLYTNISELTLVGNKLEDIDPLHLLAIEDSDPIQSIRKLKVRFVNVSSYLMFMLVLPYPVAKEVSAECIMNLISRGLAVTGSSLGNIRTTHSLALLADLPFIHTTLLKVLEALILFGQTNNLPFASRICKLAVQTLKWTAVDDWVFSTDKPFSILRSQAYLILNLWCGIGKSGSQIDDVAQQLVKLAKSDIYSEKEKVSLTQTPKQKGNRAMSTGRNVLNQLPTSKSANKDVCIAALQAMQAMIMSASFQLQPVVHKALHELIVTLLLKVTSKIEDAPIPYLEKLPRLELYKLLLQLVLDSHPNLPPPTSVALKLFSCGLRDPECEISNFCQLALSAVDKIIHPAYASLNFIPARKEDNLIGETDQPGTPHTSHNQSYATRTRLQNNADDSEPEITDAISMSVNSTMNHFSPNHRSTSVSKPSASSVLNSTLEVKNLNNVSNKGRSKTVDLTSPSPNQDVASKEERGDLKKTVHDVDLTLSDKSDDEADISEVPCEIDLADSDDDKSNVSMCSQTTLSTPQPGSASQVSKEVLSNVSASDNSLATAAAQTEVAAETKAAAETETVVETEVAVETSVTDIHNMPTQVENKTEQKNPDGGVAVAAVEESVMVLSEENPKDGESSDNKRSADNKEESSPKKQKLCEEYEFDSGEEDALLLSFQDVTRDEVEDNVD